MKTNLKENICIEGFDTLSLVYDKVLNLGGEKGIIYKGKTLNIPEDLASKCCNWTLWDEHPEKRRYYNYGNKAAVSYPFLTPIDSIKSACPENYCIIYLI